MNEWSPGGSYSRPGTPNQGGRLHKSQWDEPEKGIKPLIVNPRTAGESKAKSFQQYSMEDVTSVVSGTKTRKGGASDPRFKRVIPGGVQNDACVGTEVKASKPSSVTSDKDCAKLKVPIWSSAESVLNQGKKESGNNSGVTKPNPDIVSSSTLESMPVAGPSTLDQSQDTKKALDKLAFSHDIIVKSFSKESLTDSTINTRNTSLASEDLVDEFSNELSMFHSATRVKKVQNWILDQKSKPEKKQSVVTVIGQTQDAMSSALREIDKRRKLVKELDKYAVCRKIIESDKEKEISDLVAQISSLSSAGKIKCSEKHMIEINDPLKKPAVKGSEDKSDKFHEKADTGRNDNIVLNEPIFDSAYSNSVNRKHSSSKKKSKKICESSKCLVKGKLGQIFSRSQYQQLFCVLFVVSGILFWITLNTLQHMPYVSFDLFSPKPKPMTWYEKISMWAWELFRPSANYRRTAPWNSY